MEADREFLVQLLRIVAEADDFNPDEVEFAVITGGTTDHVVMKPGVGTEIQHGPVSYYPFQKGEIIVLPKDGFREPFGEGRSTSKYDVTEERFGRDWAAAKRRSDEVKAGPDRDGFAQPD